MAFMMLPVCPYPPSEFDGGPRLEPCSLTESWTSPGPGQSAFDRVLLPGK